MDENSIRVLSEATRIANIEMEETLTLLADICDAAKPMADAIARRK